MDLGLDGSVALVTASSKGLGRATALQLAQEGARVVICARNVDALARTRDEIAARGGTVLALPADLASPDTAQGLVDATMVRFGRLDILIGNAGGPPPGEFLALDESAWEQAIQLTLMSFVRLCYAAIPVLTQSDHGSILACTSLSVKQPLPNLVLSNSLRMGVTGLVKSLADELAPSGTRVNAICPGWTLTDRVEHLLADRATRGGTSVQAEGRAITAAIPLGCMGTPEEFARVATFLVSPAASYVTGVSLLVDGGMYRGVM
ncbi:MAG: SDR family oxidoreductase [Anaerolineae bacterium]|nr:SDR family oxidoreductase [Anaerolineae bacterium]